jgi:hypothetical protein
MTKKINGFKIFLWYHVLLMMFMGIYIIIQKELLIGSIALMFSLMLLNRLRIYDIEKKIKENDNRH